MAERRSDREVVLTSSQVLIILLLLVILMSVVFVLGISVGKRQKIASAQKEPEELPPVILKETEPEKKAQEVEKKEESPKREIITVSKFYFIQIGAFSSEASAQSFAEKFREKNYSVKVVPPLPQDKTPVYRVRVGPYLKFEEAKDVLGKLKQTGKENYFIVSEEGR